MLRTSAFPLLAAPLDPGWVVFKRFEDSAYVYVKSISASATVEVSSGPSLDPALLVAPVTLTFNQAGIEQQVAIPLGLGGTNKAFNRATRIKPLTGQVEVSVVAPSEYVSFVGVPIATTFGV